jgi:site-specific recombinase XerD
MMIDHGKLYEIPKMKYRLNLLTFEKAAIRTVQVWEVRLKRGNLKQVTYDGYCLRLRLLVKKFGKRMLWEIQKEEVENYIESLIVYQSIVTANRALFVLKQIFKTGLTEKAIINNPVANMSYSSEKDCARTRFLLPNQVDDLTKACKQLHSARYIPSLILLGAEHGASRQEALSLKWTDINFEYQGRGLIHLFRTKNGVRRTVPLMPGTKQALLQWKEHQAWTRHRKKIDSNGSQLVFCRMDGKPIRSFRTAWKKICEISGIDDFHYHDLRHTFCSNLLLSGASLKDVKDMIGHRHLETTDRYSHLTGFHKAKLYVRLSKHYSET